MATPTDDQSPSPRLANPYTTGGGGVDFETRVGAFYLAMVLLGAVPRGQNAGVTREVRFQQRYADEHLDDLVITSALPGGQAKLAIQVKHDITIGEKDEIFDGVLRDCWLTFKSPGFTRGLDRLGWATGVYTKTVDEHYQVVLTAARSSTSAADFLKRFSIRGLFNKRSRSFIRLIRQKLDGYCPEPVGDDDLWHFLRSLVILWFDVQTDGSRDNWYIVELLKQLLPVAEQTRAPDVLRQLDGYAEVAKRTAGSFDASLLREGLLADGFVLNPALDCLEDLRRLAEHAAFVLRTIQEDIAGCVLPRVTALEEAIGAVQRGGLVEIVGPPGAGKSALLKNLTERLNAEGPILVLSWDRITGPGWHTFARDLQLERPLRELLLAVSSSGSPCVVIDGADRIEGRAAQLVVNDIVREIGEHHRTAAGTPRFAVVLAARDENLEDLHDWLDWRELGPPGTVRVPDLDDDELNAIVEHAPWMGSIISLPRLRAIACNPFMLSRLADRRMSSNDLGSIATESEVSRTWWDRVVGANGSEGRGRQMALLDLGERAANRPVRVLSAQGIAPTALTSLESDRIVTRDPGRDVYRFSHDILEEWILQRVLDCKREELTTYLRQVERPARLAAPTQLLGASILEAGGFDIWQDILGEMEASTDLGPRLRQSFLTAPFRSQRATELLDGVEPVLLANSGQRLIDLLVALRTIYVVPAPSWLSSAPGVTPSIELYLRLRDPLPVWRTWGPVIEWLLRRFDDLPGPVMSEVVRTFHLWQLHSPSDAPFRREIGERALAWLGRVERWGTPRVDDGR